MGEDIFFDSSTVLKERIEHRARLKKLERSWSAIGFFAQQSVKNVSDWLGELARDRPVLFVQDHVAELGDVVRVVRIPGRIQNIVENDAERIHVCLFRVGFPPPQFRRSVQRRSCADFGDGLIRVPPERRFELLRGSEVGNLQEQILGH